MLAASERVSDANWMKYVGGACDETRVYLVGGGGGGGAAPRSRGAALRPTVRPSGGADRPL